MVERGTLLVNGSVYNELTVLDYAGRSKHSKNRVYYFRCSCGKEISAIGSLVVRGKKISCGCLRRNKKGEIVKAYKDYEDIPGDFIHRLNMQAKKRGLNVSVGIEYLWRVFIAQNRRCVFSNALLFFNFYKIRDTVYAPNASLDRIDSSKGYVEGNVQWVHKTINIMKSNMSDEEFIWWCDRVTNNCLGVRDMKFTMATMHEERITDIGEEIKCSTIRGLRSIKYGRIRDRVKNKDMVK